MADDLNLRLKTIFSLYNKHASGNIVSFWHQEDIFVSFTLHISEFVCYLQLESVPKLNVMNHIHNSSQKTFFKHVNTVMILF